MPKDDPLSGIKILSEKVRGNPWGRPPGNSRYLLLYARWGFPFGLLLGVFLGMITAYLSVWVFFWIARQL